MKTHLLNHWLVSHFGSADFVLTPLAGDASFRQYFRVNYLGKNYIVMDAAAEREKCPQFVAIAQALRKLDLQTPEIFTSDVSSGFLLLSDFGDDQLLKIAASHRSDSLYHKALDALAVLSTCNNVENYSLPLFTKQFMRDELSLFQEWFLEKHLKLILSMSTQKKLNDCFDLLAASCAAQPHVFMHRDYHSANLMVLADNHIGILDFQDAFIGPVTYDLVSLLRDCYIELPPDFVIQSVLYYRDKLKLDVDDEEFIRWFDWMGVQRHLKALLTFSRKYRRDNNANYLQHIPRTLNYVLQASDRYPELSELQRFLQQLKL